MYENFHIIPPRLYFQILHSHFDDDYLFHQQNTKVKKKENENFRMYFCNFSEPLMCH